MLPVPPLLSSFPLFFSSLLVFHFAFSPRIDLASTAYPMPVDDDLFNVPDNDEEMLENEDEDDDEDLENQDQDEAQDQEMQDDGEDEDEEEGEEDEDGSGDDNEGEEGEEVEEGEEGEEIEEGEEGDENDEGEGNEQGEEGEVGEQKRAKESESTQSQSENIKAFQNGESNTTETDHKPTVEKLPAHQVRSQVAQRAKTTSKVEIVPTTSIPYTSQCHAIALTEGPRLILTGGEDGFIRKYDFIASIEGKSPLTMAQKHNMVDSVTKAGVISSYWENEQPITRTELMQANPKIKPADFTTGTINYEPKLSPVYSLAAEKRGLWCLSGLLSGGISLYSMKYSEGSLVHYFPHGDPKRPAHENSGHNDAVSVLKLTPDEKGFFSGSWDKTIRSWDLNTGKTTATYTGASNQITSLEFRPHGLADLELADGDANSSDVDSLFGDSDNENENDNDNENGNSEQKPRKPVSKVVRNDSVFMTSSIDGTVNIWDVRVGESNQDPVIKYVVPEHVPPWCMSATWANSGDFIFAGRRNSTVEELSLKMPHRRIPNSHGKNDVIPNVSRTLQFPKISGPVSAISTMPNDDLLLCGSNDNIRLYNLQLYDQSSGTQQTTKKQATPFMIVPGHHGGILSTLYVDESGRFMVSASGNRGWGQSAFTETVLIYEIDF